MGSTEFIQIYCWRPKSAEALCHACVYGIKENERQGALSVKIHVSLTLVLSTMVTTITTVITVTTVTTVTTATTVTTVNTITIIATMTANHWSGVPTSIHRHWPCWRDQILMAVELRLRSIRSGLTLRKMSTKGQISLAIMC